MLFGRKGYLLWYNKKKILKKKSDLKAVKYTNNKVLKSLELQTTKFTSQIKNSNNFFFIIK